LFFAFAGGETALNVSGEMKNPGRTAPLGLLFGIVGTIVIFCAIQLVAQAVLGNDLANYTEAPLAEVAGKIAGPIGHTVIIAGSVIAILGILNSLPLTFSRVMFAGAKDGLMPRFLAVIHPKFATPANAIISFSVIAFIVAVSGGFRQLAIIVSATLLLIYVGVVLATIKFRITDPVKKPGTFRNPGGITVHVVALLALGLFIVQLEIKELLAVGSFIALLSFVYLVMWLKRNRKK
jgi:amino acid transporter